MKQNYGWYYLLMLMALFGLLYGVGNLTGEVDPEILDLEPKTEIKTKKVPKSPKKKTEVKKIKKDSTARTKTRKEKETKKDSIRINKPDPKNNAFKKTEDTETKKKEDLLSFFESLAAKAKGTSPRKDITVRYFKKKKDGSKLKLLSKYGFYVHERSSKKEIQHLPTNAIYYGDQIRKDDLLLVAYLLKKSGIKLQSIERSRWGSSWKATSIELGVDITLLKAPVLTLEEIKEKIENSPFLQN